ncbi:MAG: hypothetical protein Q3976_05910 [Corynebacterium sp.]|nr:hypothetical protein [Corynebacterium sp.]
MSAPIALTATVSAFTFIVSGLAADKALVVQHPDEKPATAVVVQLDK